MAPQFWGTVVFIFYLEWLPGPGTWVHVQQPSIFEQLKEKAQGQNSGLACAATHTTAAPQLFDTDLLLCDRTIVLELCYLDESVWALQGRHPKSSAIHICLCLHL